MVLIQSFLLLRFGKNITMKKQALSFQLASIPMMLLLLTSFLMLFIFATESINLVKIKLNNLPAGITAGR
ncbi:MAG: hypothetical protein BGO52_05910 [Sphingobacteriales bacterium 44-61]|nr:MAG: hypothetical protein BGO52_05910 [Sphingobacteriales bacterium 44-61]